MTVEIAGTPATVLRAATRMDSADYVRMLDPEALEIAAEFLREEAAVVRNVAAAFDHVDGARLIVIGGAACDHLADAGTLFGARIVIDPLAPTESAGAGRFRAVRRALHELSEAELGAAPALWLFTFNVYPYIDDALGSLVRLASPQDIAVVTTWAPTPIAEATRARYLGHVFTPGERHDAAARATAGHARIGRDLAHAGLTARTDVISGDVVEATVIRLSGVEAAV